MGRNVAVALAVALVLGPVGAAAESINTTDGLINVIEAVAPLGNALTYVSGGDGLIGEANVWPVPGTPAGAASAYDHQWLQYDPPIIWDAGIQLNSVFAIPGVDHSEPGEIPGENLEFIIWGSDSPLGVWEEGQIQAIYRDGFDTANTVLGHSDDYTSLWGFSKPYRFFRATSGDHLPFFDSPGEGEIDALAAPIPEPGSMLLLGTGLLALGRSLRRKR